MRLLTKSPDLSYLYNLKELLEANGIPATITGDNTARIMPPISVTEPSLWVYLDEQYPEADKLILEPGYEVKHKADVADFYNSANEISEDPKRLNDLLLNLGAGLGAILFSLFLLLKWLGA